MKLKVASVIGINKTLKSIIENRDIDAVFKFRLLGILKEFEGTVANFDVVNNDKRLKHIVTGKHSIKIGRAHV